MCERLSGSRSLSSECQMEQNKWPGVAMLLACRYATRIPNSSSVTLGLFMVLGHELGHILLNRPLNR
jgi:hypothetical protein